MTSSHIQKRLIVALDVPSVDEARILIKKLGGTVGVYKIGLELIFNGGLQLAEDLIAEGHQVFLDAKVLDIGHTIERSVANIANLNAAYLTVHGTDRKTLDAAVKGRGDADLRLLAVTVMTNLEARDLEEQGIKGTQPSELAIRRAQMAIEAGFDGVICSGQEARAMRGTLGYEPLVITPGIRMPSNDTGDQNRIVTPGQAIASGASHIVVGRPITRADNPADAAMLILDEMVSVME